MPGARLVVRPDANGTDPVFVAVCEACAWRGIPSLFKFYAEADALDHNEDKHGAPPRRKSMLIDGTEQQLNMQKGG